MACDKFETEGLLFCAGELPADAVAEYENHIGSCEECRLEIKEFQKLVDTINSPSNLAEIPSAECDAAIIAALEKEAFHLEKKVVSFGGILTLFVQRVAVPAAIFLMAITIGFQISSKSGEKSMATKSVDTSTVKTDSTADSGRIFIQGGANGVIPVTLEEKK